MGYLLSPPGRDKLGSFPPYRDSNSVASKVWISVKGVILVKKKKKKKKKKGGQAGSAEYKSTAL